MWANVSYNTFLAWYRRGEDLYLKEIVPEPGSEDAQRKQFFLSVVEAEKRFQVTLVNRIAKIGKEDWRASAWLLERMKYKDFAQRRVEIVEVQAESTDQDTDDVLGEFANERQAEDTS